MKKNSMIRKAANSFAGRLLRRILGEENGQAMMEYIVLGLLIAAACVIGVAFFGHNITGMFGVLGFGIMGDTTDVKTQRDGLIDQQGTNITNSQLYNSGMHGKTTADDQTYGKKAE